MSKFIIPAELAEHIQSIVDEVSKDLFARLALGLRFYGKDTLSSVCELIQENGGKPMPIDDLADALKKGGIAIQLGKSDAHGGTDSDIKRSIGYYAGRNQTIRYVDEKKKIVGLV